MSSSSSPADDLFAEYMCRVDAGEEVEFEEWVEQYPNHEAELRRIHEAHRALDVGFGTSGPERELERRLSRLAEPRTSASRYRVEGELARGGMGAIMRVWDEDLNRYLAMKVILDDGQAVRTRRTRLLARFLEEADLTGQLDHPGIVPVHELGLDAHGRVFFTMKLVKGQTFKEIIDLVHQAEDGWTLTRALGVLLKVCEAVSYAHAKGVLHRDLKPSNIMVGRFGEVYVMDWGLARYLGEPEHADSRLPAEPGCPPTGIHSVRQKHIEAKGQSPLYTDDGEIVGTLAYMAPEQVAGSSAKLSGCSDVYSIGAILYNLICGLPPYFTADAHPDNQSLLEYILEGPPPPVSSRSKSIPPELAAICNKAMERDPKRRYPGAHQLAADLQSYLEGRIVSAYGGGAFRELFKWMHRNRIAATSLALGLAIAMTGLLASISVKSRANSQLQAAVYDLQSLGNILLANQEINFLRTMIAQVQQSPPQNDTGEGGAVDRQAELRTLMYRLDDAQERAVLEVQALGGPDRVRKAIERHKPIIEDVLTGLAVGYLGVMEIREIRIERQVLVLDDQGGNNQDHFLFRLSTKVNSELVGKTMPFPDIEASLISLLSTEANTDALRLVPENGTLPLTRTVERKETTYSYVQSRDGTIQRMCVGRSGVEGFVRRYDLVGYDDRGPIHVYVTVGPM